MLHYRAVGGPLSGRMIPQVMLPNGVYTLVTIAERKFLLWRTPQEGEFRTDAQLIDIILCKMSSAMQLTYENYAAWERGGTANGMPYKGEK